jgi:hypothetical protein
MYAKIIITGQLNGNLELIKKFRLYDSKRELPFNNFALHYKNASQAQKDITNVYKSLKMEEDNKYSGLRLYRTVGKRPERLLYDASWAIIERVNPSRNNVLIEKK